MAKPVKKHCGCAIACSLHETAPEMLAFLNYIYKSKSERLRSNHLEKILLRANGGTVRK